MKLEPPPLRPTGTLAHVHSAQGDLPPALKRLAKVILDAPDQVIYLSITELAERARVGEASVIRFCRDLSYKGFQDFKLALAADRARSDRWVSEADTSGSLASIPELVAREAQQALNDTRDLLELPVLEDVVELLLGATQLLIYGAGASGITAHDFAYKFLRLGYVVTVHSDPHLAAMSAATLGPEAVMIGITRSGTTVDTIRALELAKARGVPTIVITQRGKSPAAKLADHKLYIANTESPLTGGSIAIKIGQLLILDALFTALLSQCPRAQEFVAHTAQAVTDRNI